MDGQSCEQGGMDSTTELHRAEPRGAATGTKSDNQEGDKVISGQFCEELENNNDEWERNLELHWGRNFFIVVSPDFTVRPSTPTCPLCFPSVVTESLFVG